MNKDRRYATVKILIQGGHVKNFHDILDVIPASIVYKDLGINYSRFKKLINNTKLFTIEELVILASFCDLEGKTLIDLAYQQYIEDKKLKRKK